MDFTTARVNMVESQVRANGVQDGALLAAMAAVPRELFVPKTLRSLAYVDKDLDLGAGRWLTEPLVLARLLQAAAVQPTDIVLVVGDSCGYATALAARLASYVLSLDTESESAQRAAPVLTELGLTNVDFVLGPLAAGHPAKAPYDAVVLAGAAAELPAVLGRQLAEGGRLAAVIRGADGAGKGVLAVRAGDTVSRRPLFDAATPLLPGMAARPGFVF